MTASKPNILYLHSHDTGRYIQPYGHAIPTPKLQKFAEEGVLFRQAFTVNPTCSPSRAALVTGCWPHENGMLGLAHRGFSLNDYGQHIIHRLREAGYSSTLCGVQHVASHQEGEPWQKIGYDQAIPGHEKAVESVNEFFASQKDNDQPFFLAVGFRPTHRDFPPLEECPDNPNYCLPPAPLPDTPETRIDMARYKACARILDDWMGGVLEALDTHGLAENTLVILTTDHGIAFPRMKCNLQDSGTGIMLMMRGPGGFEGGKVVDAMVTHMDIFPTICDIVGIDRPDYLRGESLAPLVNGSTDEIHEALFFEVNYHAAYEPMRAVRTQRYKYIKRYDKRTAPVLPNCDDGESKQLWMDNGWKNSQPAQAALYDLIFDPNEMDNRIDDPDLAEVVQCLENQLQKWMEETNDPLLADDHVPAPKGAKVNNADGNSPKEAPEIIE